MKKMTLKLFLVFGVIILSLFAFASCEEENTEEANEYEIYNDELISFIISSGFSSNQIDGPSPIYPYVNLSFFYDFKDIYELLEFEASGKSQLVCCYITPSTLNKIVDTDTLSFDDTYSFEHLLINYMNGVASDRIDVDEDKLRLYSFPNNNIPYVYNGNTLVFVCELYTLNFNDGTSTKVVLKHDGKVYFPNGKTEDAFFKPKQKIESISSFTYKSQNGLILRNFLKEYMWNERFLQVVRSFEYINEIPCLRYSPESCSQAFTDAIRGFEKISYDEGHYLKYSDVKGLLEIK